VAAENATPPVTDTTVDGAATSSDDGASASPADTASAAGTADGAKADGAKTAASQDGVQTAAVTAPSNPEQKKEVAGPPQPSRAPGSILFDQTHDNSALDPMSWAVSVVKKRHELTIYYKGRLFRKYEAVFGRNLDLGAKLWAQDRRTPEGVYNIVEKYPSMRFHWFLRLNYPNLVDRVRYETLRVNGVVPVDHDGKAPEVGSAIGIHGTDVPVLNAGQINWTTGCISVDNKDIEDLERLLPVGTVVIIKP
jgi:murein L,D-transpeptidase YafK